MPTSSITHLPQQREDGQWVVVGPKQALTHLCPLIESHRSHRPVRVVEANQPQESHLEGAAALLLIGDARHSPRSALPGMFLRAANGRRIPCGWLPDVGERLAKYARAAAQVQLRQVPPTRTGPVLLLGEFSTRALEWVQLFSAELPQDMETFQWTAERIRRRDLAEALRAGAAAAFYFGHSTSCGWAGYGGFNKFDAAAACGCPLGCVISFSCLVARRPLEGLSFCEELVLTGLCAAAVGSTRLSLHYRNIQWSLALARAMNAVQSANLCDLLSHPLIPAAAVNSYRILGDPMTPLMGDVDCHARSRNVFAPAPEDMLPVIPLGHSRNSLAE